MFEYKRVLYDKSVQQEADFEKVCDFCKTTLSDFWSSGIVGCANCYKVFQKEICEYVFKNQGTVNHVGKVSSKHFSKSKLSSKISELEEKKNKAVQEEDFILAEALKNQIEKLKGEL